MNPAIPNATSARRIMVTTDCPPNGRRVYRASGGREVGLAGIEPATSPLSGVRSNRLSYSPAKEKKLAGLGLDEPPEISEDSRYGERTLLRPR